MGIENVELNHSFGEKSGDLEYRRRKGCYAVIFDAAKQHIATIVTARGHYFLPGGGMEDGEKPEECLRREVLEETGYEIEIVSYIGRAERYFISTLDEPLLSDGNFYLAEMTHKIQEPIESDHFLKWLNIENADEYLFHEHHSWAVKSAFAKFNNKCIDNIRINLIDLNHTGITELVNESLNEGHRHIRRLLDDYKSGRNTFSEEGEALFAAVWNDRIVGLCGLNKDPYQDDKGIGRIRRLYVLKAYRRHGVGRKLMDAVIQEAGKHYSIIVLRTDHPVADLFYRSLGFSDQPEYSNSTHYLILKNGNV